MEGSALHWHWDSAKRTAIAASPHRADFQRMSQDWLASPESVPSAERLGGIGIVRTPTPAA